MASASTLRREWVHAVVVAPQATVGWVGSGPARVASDDGVTVVLDGSIHNRAELELGGTDAEGFLGLYQRRGFEGAMKAVNGEIAVAVIDERADRLWIGRDRLGVKPMYWAPTPDGIAFSSQPRGVLAHPGVRHDPRPEYVALVAGGHYRSFDNDREGSPYADVRQLPAAHLLESGPSGATTRPYWALQDEGDMGASESEVAEQYRTLLADAVGIRLVSWSRPAFTLSGGMDSSSILASAVAVTGSPQHAFSSVYRDPTYDERFEIASMLERNVAEWHAVPVDDPDLLPLVAEMIAVHDEPVATATWLSHWRIAEQVAAEGFDVVFGGLGGDELNAGEYEYFVFHHADLLAANRTEELDHEIACWAIHHDHPIWRKSREVMEGELARRVDRNAPGRNLPDLPRLRRYAQTVRPEYFDLGSYLPVMDHPFGSHLKNRAYQDLFRETTPCCLRAEDRHAAAFGIEHADPFLDHRLVELLFRVSGDRKIRDGMTKVILREAMRDVLPEETRTRVKKTGWNAPAHVWFSGGSGAAVRDLIESATFRERGIYDVPEVRRLFDEHQAIVASAAAVENHMMFLWQLVNLELWLRWVDATW